MHNSFSIDSMFHPSKYGISGYCLDQKPRLMNNRVTKCIAREVMNIEIDWQYTGEGEDNIDYSRVLYAYLHSRTSEILYIGKAGRCTVRERLLGEHKEAIFYNMINQLGISTLHAIVGVLSIPEQRKYSMELLSDVESLLIMKIQPVYNKQSRKRRISRPGMQVCCKGAWPHVQGRFKDE